MSKLIRIENGTVSVSANDLNVLLDFYGVRDDSTVSRLVQLRRLSQQRHRAAGYRAHISQAHMDVAGYEHDARHIKQFHPTVVPVLLQTEAYARALIEATPVRPPTKEAIDAHVTTRLHRQSRIFSTTDPARLTVIVEETALLRPIGGPGIMQAQLDHLIAACGQANVDLLIIPAGIKTHPGLIDPFSILEFDSDDDPDLAYLDVAPHAHAVVEDPDEVEAYKSAFGYLLGFTDPDTEPTARLRAVRRKFSGGALR